MNKIIFYKLLILSAVTFLLSGCGEAYRGAASGLMPRLQKVLIQHHVCENDQDCRNKDVMLGEHGNRVNINFYGIKDEKIVSAIFKVVVDEGATLTGNAPITVRVFTKSKSENLGVKATFGLNTPAFQLDINNKSPNN
jgi:hypothetical protein